MYEELVKSLRWLGFMFPETHPARDDADRISNNIHLDCTQAADAIEELQAQLMFSNDAAKAIAEKVPKWIPVTERLPSDFVSVQAHMTDAGNFPSVREAYVVNKIWFFPALKEFHPVDMWKRFDEPPKEEI